MYKFKIGDRVKCIYQHSSDNLIKGDIGVISSFNINRAMPIAYMFRTGQNVTFHEDNLELRQNGLDRFIRLIADSEPDPVLKPR